jgi:tetratricopeptide (TPR) repeat protein
VESLIGQAVGELMHGRIKESHRIGEELRALAQPEMSSHAAISANQAVGNAQLHLGEIDAAVDHLKRGVALLGEEPVAVSDARYGPALGLRAALGTALTTAGQVESGWASILAAVDLAKSSGVPWYHGFALSTLISAAIFRRLPAEARRHSAELLAHCESHGIPYWPTALRVYLAWAEVVETRDPAFLDALVRAVDDARGVARLGWPRITGLLADACLCLGRLDDASRALDEAFDPTWEERLYYAELWRLRAAVALARPARGKRAVATQHDEAERILLRGLEMADSQGARLFGLRITVDLCRLWQATGNLDRARRQLGRAIAGFHEGSGEVDLRAANELFARLSA